jgi:hypothetical protein
MNCENNILDIGCYNHCSTIEFDVTALFDGVYTYLVKVNNENFSLEKSHFINDFLSLDLMNFNENARLIISIIDPNGDSVIFSSNGIDYSSILLKTLVLNKL